MPRRTERRSLGLRARATLVWAAIALVLAGTISLIEYQVIRAELVDERRERAASQAYLNARLVRSGLRATQPDIGAVLASLEGNAGSAGVVRVDGEWFASSVGVDPTLLPESLVDAVAGGQAGRAVARVDGEPHVVVGVPIAESSAEYFELVSVEDVDATLGSLARSLIVTAAGATATAAVVGWYASGRVLRPLRRMAGAASHIADGELDTRLDALGDPDLEPLQTSFNRMADAVEERITREQRFTADVSHELRSPLAAMLSSIAIARRHGDDPVAVGEALDHLQERTEAFRELVEDLVEISRVDAGVADLHLEELSPEALARAAIEMTGAEGVEIEVSPAVPPTIPGDKRRLGRCLMSLLENAEKYAGGATRVEIERTDRGVRFSVEDAGPGIAPHERRHVFARFARGERARASSTGGTGLGLALVAEHVRLHGGRVAVDEAEGGGGRFSFDVPVGEERS